MKCEKSNAEFTVKEQAKAKGRCPSCGEKPPASACCDDAKAWRWYQCHSPMPLSMILAYLGLVGGCILAVLIPVSEYCPGVPDRRWWLLFRGAPLGLKHSAICLILLVCLGSFAYTPESIGLMCDWLKGNWRALQLSGQC